MSAWFGELGQFLWAVINNWAGYATGGLIVALLWLWSSWSGKQTSRKISIGFALLFLVIAFFNAWRDQHHSALDAQVKLAELTVPDLSRSTLSVMTTNKHSGMDWPDSEEVVQGTIYNLGAPTVITAWSFKFSFADGSSKKCEVMLRPPNDGHITIHPSSEIGGSTRILDGDKWWPLQAVSHPIERNGGDQGWMWFLCRGLSQQRIRQERPTAILGFVDVTGREWKAAASLEDGPMRSPYSPQDLP